MHVYSLAAFGVVVVTVAMRSRGQPVHGVANDLGADIGLK